MRGSAAVSSSSSAPVPSGELSSTNNSSAPGSAASSPAEMPRTLSRSLYVGTTISACGMVGADHSDPSAAPQRAMLAMVRSRRAWVYMLSVAALIVPAGGIAYLGAVSYRDERGAVSAQNERQRQAALGIASRISRAVDDAMDATERAAAAGSRTVAAPLARYWFWIDADQRLRVPHSAPAQADPGGALERASCAASRTERSPDADGEQRQVVGEAGGAEGGAEGEVGADVIADAPVAEQAVDPRAGEDELGEPGRRGGRIGGGRCGGGRVDVVNDGELVVGPCVALAVAHASACC